MPRRRALGHGPTACAISGARTRATDASSASVRRRADLLGGWRAPRARRPPRPAPPLHARRGRCGSHRRLPRPAGATARSRRARPPPRPPARGAGPPRRSIGTPAISRRLVSAPGIALGVPRTTELSGVHPPSGSVQPARGDVAIAPVLARPAHLQEPAPWLAEAQRRLGDRRPGILHQRRGREPPRGPSISAARVSAALSSGCMGQQRAANPDHRKSRAPTERFTEQLPPR